MHSGFKLSAGYYIILALYIFVALGALAVIIDAMRSKRAQALDSARAAGKKREPLWLYQIVAGAYLLVFILSQLNGIPDAVHGVAIFGVPVMFAFFFVYLLRVVFPKRATALVDADATHDEEISDNDHR